VRLSSTTRKRNNQWRNNLEGSKYLSGTEKTGKRQYDTILLENGTRRTAKKVLHYFTGRKKAIEVKPR